jgi:N-acetylmuramoyl-L-alanine amidase
MRERAFALEGEAHLGHGSCGYPVKKLLLTALAALALAPVAHAGHVAMQARDVPLGPRALQAAIPPMHFNMLGVHWAGSGSVEYRTHRLHGAWRLWRAVDDDARPDAASHERSRAWRDGNIDWAGASDDVQFRTHGTVRRLRAYYLWSRVTTAPERGLSFAGKPRIVTRTLWQADEKIKREKPRYAPAIKAAVVHHTAGTNSYSPAQAAAIVRGIEIYHVKGNGWDDIGYNFLVDRFGTVYEGRWGGIERNVIGAHAEGFNVGTVGVAMIGNYSSATPPVAQQDAVVNLLAWRLDVAHVDPTSTVAFTSTGNPRYRSGRVVTLRAVSAHRDTGPSECPGSRAYALIPALTSRVAATALPKLYSPVVSGALGGSIRFQGRLSTALPWTVTVTTAAGKVLAKGSGTASTVDWTWNSARAGKGPFAWRIDAGPTVRPATGTLGGTSAPAAPATALTLTGLTATPAVIGPPPDGTGTIKIAFNLGIPARVTASVRSVDGGGVVTILDQDRAKGRNTLDVIAAGLRDGRYTVLVSATAGGKRVEQQVEVVVDRTLFGFGLAAPVTSPNGDGVLDTLPVSFTLTQTVPVRLEILRAGVVVGSVLAGTTVVGPHTIEWNGLSLLGPRVPDGAYQAAVVVTDALGEVAFTAPFKIDTTPPVITLLDLATLRFQLSEPATVSFVVNGQQLEMAAPKGVFTVPFTGRATFASALPRDAAGNVGALVKSP